MPGDAVRLTGIPARRSQALQAPMMSQSQADQVPPIVFAAYWCTLRSIICRQSSMLCLCLG